MASKAASISEFMALFESVKREAAGDPGKLRVFYGQKQALKDAVDRLMLLVAFGAFERQVFHEGSKYVAQAPVDFEREWKEYTEDWASPLLFCWLNLDGLDLSALLKALSTEESPSSDLSTISGPGNRRHLRSPDPDLDDEFDPMIHDAESSLQMAFWTAESYADMVGNDFAGGTAFASKIGLEAYRYLVDTIGLDTSGAFRRWRNVPLIFMPAHISNHYGSERGSLFDLLDNAVRAYVFGAPAAAIAMCRALLEMLLKEHYGLDCQYVDALGRTRDKGMGELIILADAKYEFFQGPRIRRLTDSANRILHNYSSREALPEKDEMTILDFLKTIKFLIQRAPK
jgi:hypothetical protein